MGRRFRGIASSHDRLCDARRPVLGTDGAQLSGEPKRQLWLCRQLGCRTLGQGRPWRERFLAGACRPSLERHMEHASRVVRTGCSDVCPRAHARASASRSGRGPRAGDRARRARVRGSPGSRPPRAAAAPHAPRARLIV